MLKSFRMNVFMILLLLVPLCITLSARAQKCSQVGISVSGRIATVKGAVEDPRFLNNSMTILLRDAHDGIVHAGSFHCMQNGSFTYSFGLPETAKTGAYRLVIGMFGSQDNLYADQVTLVIGEEEPEEDILFQWTNLSEIGTVPPGDCGFSIYEKNPEPGDWIAYQIDGGETRYVSVAGKYTSVILGDITKGVHTIGVTVENGETQKLVYTDRFAVMEAYTPQFMEEFNFRGVGTHYAHNTMWDIDIDFAAYAGIKNIRDGIKWSLVEKNPGVFNFAVEDRWVGQISEKNRRLAPLLGFNNYNVYTMYHHATGERIQNSNYIPRGSLAIENFIRYVEKTMDHYPQFDEYELWNEPNSDQTLGAVDYAELAMNTAVALKRQNRFSLLNVLSLMAVREADWARENFASGIYPYMTGIAFHPYVQGVADDGTQEQKYENIYRLIVDNGGWKDMNITEVGWATHTSGTSEADAAIALVKQNHMVENYDVTGNYWYDLVNDGVDATYNEHNFGLIDASRKVKPAYIAFKELNQKLAGAVYLGELHPAENARMFVYGKDGNTLLTAWTVTGSGTVEFDAGVTVEDLYGNVLAQNVKTVTLGTAPVYIKGAGKEWLAKAGAETIKEKAERWLRDYGEVLPGELLASAEAVFSADAQHKGADELEALQAEYRQLGLDIIRLAEERRLGEKDASKALYELYRILNTVNRMYLVSYGGAAKAQLESDLEGAIALSEARYYEEFNMMQYSEEILRYARRFHTKAQAVLESQEDNPLKAGMISGWDLMSDIMIDWFEAFSAFETKFSYGLLLNVNLETSAYLDTAKQGGEKAMKLYVSNRTGSEFYGKLQVYDQKGRLVYTTPDSFRVAPGKDALRSLSFPVEDEPGLNSYTLVLTDEAGNTLVRRPHEIQVYTEEAPGYPDHEGRGNYTVDDAPKKPDLTYRAVESSDEARVFEVDGRRFVLLDRDGEGNYFIAADEVYGTKGFNLNDQTDANTQQLQESGTWKYDPSHANNIGHWLNSRFLTGGNAGMRLPEAVVQRLLEKEWDIEFAEEAGISASYSVNAKIALLSATEWMYYSDRLGYTPYNAPYKYPDSNGNNTYTNEAGRKVNDGWWLRTPINQKGMYGAFVSVYRAPAIPGMLANWSVRSKNQQRYIRPVFWVDSEFFAEVPVALDTVGTAVKLQIARTDSEKLQQIYTAEQLRDLGIITVRYEEDRSACTVVFPDNIEAAVWKVQYDLNGRLTGIEDVSEEINQGTVQFQAEERADQTRIFIWNHDMVPLVRGIRLTKSY